MRPHPANKGRSTEWSTTSTIHLASAIDNLRCLEEGYAIAASTSSSSQIANLSFPRLRRVFTGRVTSGAYTRHELNLSFMDPEMTMLRQSIETYILAKDGNRPHLMSRAFAADAELVMDVKTDEISFPKTVKGLADISATLVSQFAQRYENIYTFCTGTPADNAAAFRCKWLVCMTEKLSGAVRVGFGDYEWLCRDDSGMISKLKITIEEMKILPSEFGDSILEWARMLPYPWCGHDLLLRNAPNIPAAQEIARNLARCQ